MYIYSYPRIPIYSILIRYKDPLMISLNEFTLLPLADPEACSNDSRLPTNLSRPAHNLRKGQGLSSTTMINSFLVTWRSVNPEERSSNKQKLHVLSIWSRVIDLLLNGMIYLTYLLIPLLVTVRVESFSQIPVVFQVFQVPVQCWGQLASQSEYKNPFVTPFLFDTWK